MNRLVLHVLGARPNFMKAAPVVSALHRRVRQYVVHTGQHYDERMSDVFFGELGLPEPDINLGVGSGTHAHQTAGILTAVEEVLIVQQPAVVVVYGDVNSTIAAALAASKLQIPTAHVEAGLRSFDRTMPEEINRILTDAIAELLFVTSPEGVDHLAREGIPADRIHFVGNPMIDTLKRHRRLFMHRGTAEKLGIAQPFAVATLHRPSNVDDENRLSEIIRELDSIANEIPIVFPVHPRRRERISRLVSNRKVDLVDPLGYLDFMSLVANSSLIMTDSGGLQAETTILGIPCLTVRPNTEQPITITSGTNRLVEPEALADAARHALSTPIPSPRVPPLWDGRAGVRIAQHIVDSLG